MQFQFNDILRTITKLETNQLQLSDQGGVLIPNQELEQAITTLSTKKVNIRQKKAPGQENKDNENAEILRLNSYCSGN